MWNVKCVTKKKYIWKKIRDNTKGFKDRINQRISDCKTGVSRCKFPRNIYDCGIKKNCLEEPFFGLNILLRFNKSDRLETIETYYIYIYIYI